MLPLRLRAENYGPYPELDVTFDEGCTVVLGRIEGGPIGVDSNGCGKSHLLNGIAVALYGPPKGVSLPELLSNDGASTELMVELTFEHQGETYRVRRSHSARTKAGKSTLDLEQDAGGIVDDETDEYLVEPSWIPLTAESIAATQERIETLLGLSRETFLASSLMQQDALSFASPHVSRVQRFELLADALALDEWERYLALAKRDRRTAQQALDELAGRIGAREAELERLPDLERDLAAYAVTCERVSEELASAELALERTREQWVAAEARLSERRTAEAKLQAAKNALGPLEEALHAGVLARTLLAEAEAQLASLTTAEQLAAAEQAWSEARAEYDRVQHERQVIEAKIANTEQSYDQATAEWERLELDRALKLNEAAKLDAHDWRDDAEACALCKRPLNDPVARQAVVEAYRAKAKEIERRMVVLSDAAREDEARLVAARDELAALRLVALPDDGTVQKARADQSERARLEERIRAWRQQIEDVEKPGFDHVLTAAREEVALAEKLLAELPLVSEFERRQIQQEGLKAKAVVEAKREELRVAGEQKARAEAELERLGALAAQAATDRLERERLNGEVDLLAQMERAYGRDGIPALVVENVAIPYLEAEATRLLQRLGLPWQVELRTERANKSREGTQAVLDVVVVKEHGVEQPYLLFSGGEETRINYALRIALARLLKHRRGADSQLLGLDEPKFLDAAGMQALTEILHELGDEFPVRLLISHIGELRDAFDQSIEVVRENGRSRIETGAREAVAA